MSRIKYLFIILVSFVVGTAYAQHKLVFSLDQNPELIANAGEDQGLVPSNSIILGAEETASGGSEEYTYEWAPIDFLDDATTANPIANVEVPTTYVLTVVDSKGCVSKDTVMISTITQLADDLLIEQFDVFPNPTEGVINIKLKSDQTLQNPSISLINGEGKILFHKKFKSTNFIEDVMRVELLSKGVYFIRLIEADNVLTKKILFK